MISAKEASTKRGAEKPISSSELDKKLPYELLMAGVERIRECMQCGTCTASCPSGRRTAYRTRLLIRKALLGLKDDLLKNPDLWLCTTCYTCYERCPRKISIVETIVTLRNMAAAQGQMLSKHREIVRYLLEHGHLVPINEANMRRRVEVGLPDVPPTVQSYPDGLQEVKRLLELTGLQSLVR